LIVKYANEYNPSKIATGCIVLLMRRSARTLTIIRGDKTVSTGNQIAEFALPLQDPSSPSRYMDDLKPGPLSRGDQLSTHIHRRDDFPPATLRSSTIQGALIDNFVFSRYCLMEAFASEQSDITLLAFDTIRQLIASGVEDVDIIVYHHHGEAPFDMHMAWGDPSVCEALAGIPIIVLLDATSALDPQTIRHALESGVKGFISTRTSEMPTVSAAIRFVKAGGTFAPVEPLLANKAERAPAQEEVTLPSGLLTSTQMKILSHVREGKPNKIIAYELKMSESTVKVHIRNIMRKMGATNRTQAVYKLQQLSNDAVSKVLAGD
jgi:DNA-binding NarL/FixJ family response regulator